MKDALIPLLAAMGSGFSFSSFLYYFTIGELPIASLFLAITFLFIVISAYSQCELLKEKKKAEK